MKKETPLVIVLVVFLLGIATLVVSAFSIEHSDPPFDAEVFDRRFGASILLVVSCLIPLGVVLPLFNFTGDHFSIVVAFVSFVQLAVIGTAVALVYSWLRRFSPLLRFFGVSLIYMGLCYGTNRLYIPALSFATPHSASLLK